MNTNYEKLKDSIKNLSANLGVIASFYAGFAFFSPTLLFDIALLVIILISLLLWQSRTAALILVVFSIASFYFQLQNPFEAGGWKIALIIWMFVTGVLVLNKTIALQKGLKNGLTSNT